MTDRETEVARLIEQGMTNAEIAAELFITPKAVEYHLGNIYAKFGLKGRLQLLRMLSDARPPQALWRGLARCRPGSVSRQPASPGPVPAG